MNLMKKKTSKYDELEPNGSGDEEQTTAVAVRNDDQFKVMTIDGNKIKTIIKDNLGADGLKLSDLERITVPSGGGIVWEVPGLEGLETTKELTGIMIASQTGRKFWTQSFDETGGGTPPDCYSPDGVTGIGSPGGECATCPNAQFGTADNGRGRGQACSEFRSILMVLKDEILPVVITAPAMSLSPIRKYLRGLVSRQLPLHAVYTRLTLEKDKNKDGITYAKIVPVKVGDVENPDIIKSYADNIKPYLVQVAQDLLQIRDPDDR